ncbi:MAG: DUF4340 domain-containing protein [Deltaproteobacteria bacterium]|nr:DUF4340 domain-containing protein [Deltaproteobacteria bacterium]
MRQVGILAALLLVALVATYLSWHAEESDTSTKDLVAIYRAAPEDLQKVTWTAEELTTTLERLSDAGGEYIWISVAERVEVEPEPAEDSVDTEEIGPQVMEESPPPEPEPQFEVRSGSFKGNQAAEDLWGNFAPLQALRELKTSGEVDDAAFGFDPPFATVEVLRRSGPLALVVGGETYGAKDRYLRADGKVFLVDDKTLRPLQYAKTRLVDRVLQPLSEREAEQIEVRAQGQSVAFVHKNKDDRAASFWAAVSTPGEEDVAAATWLGKVMRLRIQAFTPPDEIPTDLEPVFTYVMTGNGESWTVEILREVGTEAPKYYARSGYSRATVQLTQSIASEAVADLDSILPPAL